MDNLRTVAHDWLIELNFTEASANIIVGLMIVALWIIIGIVFNFIVRKLIYRVVSIRNNDAKTVTIAKLLSSVLKYVVWFVITIVVLSEFGIDITPFIASAGVIGLAVGFGAQEIVKDFISGFFIIFEGSFTVGDVIEVDGFKGNVLSLGLRTTIIENWKGEQKVINNGEIRGLVNFSKNNSIAVVEFGIAYETDLSEFNELMKKFTLDSFNNYEDILQEPSFSGVKELADSSINMILIAKTKNMAHFNIERKLREDIVTLCNENNVSIPYPHVVVKND